MSKIVIGQIVDPNFGKCTTISNGKVELHVTTDFGPRVIHCACTGMENMFFQDLGKNPLGEKYDIYEDQIILYGGHRVWFSPEALPRCYHPDNQPVTVTEVEGGVRFTAAIEKHNQIQKTITITLDENEPRVKLIHSIRNVGTWDIQLAPWAITMMAPGGIEVMPMPNRASGVLANRNFSFWDYTELNDNRAYLGKEFLTLRQDSTSANPYKIGYNNEAGWAAYFNRGQVFIKYFEPVLGGFYPDNGCCYETYTNSNMLEMETLGEMTELEPDDFVTLEEEWELYPSDAITDPKNEEHLKESVKNL